MSQDMSRHTSEPKNRAAQTRPDLRRGLKRLNTYLKLLIIKLLIVCAVSIHIYQPPPLVGLWVRQVGTLGALTAPGVSVDQKDRTR